MSKRRKRHKHKNLQAALNDAMTMGKEAFEKQFMSGDAFLAYRFYSWMLLKDAVNHTNAAYCTEYVADGLEEEGCRVVWDAPEVDDVLDRDVFLKRFVTMSTVGDANVATFHSDRFLEHLLDVGWDRDDALCFVKELHQEIAKAIPLVKEHELN